MIKEERIGVVCPGCLNPHLFLPSVEGHASSRFHLLPPSFCALRMSQVVPLRNAELRELLILLGGAKYDVGSISRLGTPVSQQRENRMRFFYWQFFPRFYRCDSVFLDTSAKVRLQKLRFESNEFKETDFSQGK